MTAKGHIQIHRKMEDSIVFQDPYYLKLWMWLLFRARFKPGEVMIGRTTVHLNVGQLIWGREEAAKILNKGLRGKAKKSESTWENYLKDLEKLGMLNRKPNSKYTVVTIVNYKFYQMIDNESSQQNKQRFNSTLTTNSQQINSTLTQKNNDNKDNTVNNVSSLPDINKLNIYARVEREFGRPLSPMEIETIGTWLTQDGYAESLIDLALKEAVLNQAYNLKYIDKILLTWERKNIRTVSEAQENIRKRNERSVSHLVDPPEEELPEVPMFDWVNQKDGG